MYRPTTFYLPRHLIVQSHSLPKKEEMKSYHNISNRAGEEIFLPEKNKQHSRQPQFLELYTIDNLLNGNILDEKVRPFLSCFDQLISFSNDIFLLGILVFFKNLQKENKKFHSILYEIEYFYSLDRDYKNDADIICLKNHKEFTDIMRILKQVSEQLISSSDKLLWIVQFLKSTKDMYLLESFLVFFKIFALQKLSKLHLSRLDKNNFIPFIMSSIQDDREILNRNNEIFQIKLMFIAAILEVSFETYVYREKDIIIDSVPVEENPKLEKNLILLCNNSWFLNYQTEKSLATNRINPNACNICKGSFESKQMFDFRGCDHKVCRVCLSDYLAIETSFTISKPGLEMINCPTANCSNKNYFFQVTEFFKNLEKTNEISGYNNIENQAFPDKAINFDQKAEKTDTKGSIKYCPRCKFSKLQSSSGKTDKSLYCIECDKYFCTSCLTNLNSPNCQKCSFENPKPIQNKLTVNSNQIQSVLRENLTENDCRNCSASFITYLLITCSKCKSACCRPCFLDTSVVKRKCIFCDNKFK